MAGLEDYLTNKFDPQVVADALARRPYTPPTPVTSNNTWIGGGINAGIREMRGMGGAAIEALGKVTGLQGVEQWGAEAARNNLQRAQEVGRPDLEVAPWKEGGASVAPWVIYQGAKMLPTLAAMIGAGAATGGSGLVPAAAARAGAAVPAWLGGGGGLAGAAALETGKRFAGNAIGATLAGYLPAAGGIYNEAKQAAEATGQETTGGQAAAALGLGLPSALIGAAQPQILRNILGREVGEAAGRGAAGVASRIADDFIKGGVTQVPVAAVQRATEMALRPDLDMGQKAHEVIDAAITGGVLGGVFGAGTGGIREIKGRRPASFTNEDLTSTVDGQLELPLRGGQGDVPAQAPDVEAPTRPFQQLTERQLELKLANAEKGATLGLPSDVTLMNQLLAERQMRQPELPLEGGYADNLTAPIQTRYDLDRPAPPVEPPPVIPDQSSFALEGGEARVPALGDPEARPLRNKPFNELERVVAGLTDAETVRPLSAEESMARQLALGEIQARAAATPDPKQLDLGLKPIYAPEIENLSGYMGEPGTRPQPQGLTRADRLQDIVGKDTRLPRTVLDAPDLPTAMDLIDQAAAKAKTPNWAVRAAERLGLDGTLDDRLAQAQKRVQDEQMGLEQWRGEGPPDPLNLQKAQSELFDLQQRKAAVEEMEYRRANPGESKWTGENQDGNWAAFSKVPEPTDTPVFSSAADPAFTPIADAPLKVVLDRWTKRLGASADRLRIVPTVADLPEKVRQSALDQGTPLESIRGAYSDGVGWLVRDRLRNEADVQEVIAHEMFGHGGAKAAFDGSRFDRFNQLFDKAGGVEGIMRIARKFDADGQLRDYIPEGKLTDLDKARFFDEMLAQAAGKTDGTLRQAALSWMGTVKQNMISMLESMGLTALARRMDTFTSLDTAVMLRSMRKAVQAGFEVPANHETAFSRVNATVPEANENMKQVVQQGAEPVLQAIKNFAGSAVPTLRKIEFHTLSPLYLLQKYRTHYPVDANNTTAPDRFWESRELSLADRGTLGRMNETALRPYNALPTKKQETLRQFAETANMNKFVPGKGWDAHPWLHDKPHAEALKQQLNAFNQDYQRIFRDQQMRPAYENMVAAHNASLYMKMLSQLKAIVQVDDTVPHQTMPSLQTDPMAVFRQKDTVHPDIKGTAVHFRTALDALMKDVQTHLDTQRGRIDGTSDAARIALEAQTSGLMSVMQNMRQSLASDVGVPYAHLGRTGDYFVGGKIKVGADGKIADQRALQALKAEAEAKGFNNFSITMGADNPNLFVRVETPTQAQHLYDFLGEMAKKGYIQQGSTVRGLGMDPVITEHIGSMVPKYTDHLISRLRESSVFKVPDNASPEDAQRITQMRSVMENQIRDAMVDMLPAEALGRFMASRTGAQGVGTNFGQNQARRLEAGANSFAGMYHGVDQMKALQQTYADVRAAETGSKLSVNELADMKRLYSLFAEKQMQPVVSGGSKWADIARSGIHSWLTALSPAYALVQQVTTPLFTWPELGKQFGMMKSAKAIAGATTPALNLLRIAVQEGMRERGFHGAADMVISRAVMDKANIPKGMQNYLVDLMVNGKLDIGSQSRELGMLADSDVPGVAKRAAQYANVLGFASEASTKLTAAIAVYNLAKGSPDLNRLASRVLDNTAFNFSPNNTSRLLDPHNGPFGKATGVASVFMRFQSMLIEKLYREMHQALAGDTPQAKSEARKFLAGHLAAMTVLGGTMSLPMVSVMARAVDKMVDLTQEEGSAPFDVKLAWRDFLGSVFGKEMGEIAARGLPRAFGADMSSRVGEQDIIPFSRFLTDRRKAEDSIEDLALRMGGAGVASVVNIWDGLADLFVRGDTLQGMIKVVPSFMRNPLIAYRMDSLGYADEKNAPLGPALTPTARSIAVQALGFTPSEMAEYREHRQAMLVRKTDLESNASIIRKHLATAMEQGDQEGVRSAMQRMVNHDRLNPAYAVGPGLAGALAARQQAPLVARMTGQPLGANIRDVGAWGKDTTFNWRQ